MARNFITITQDDIDLKIIQNIKSRELELASYDFEAANHQAAIDALGSIKWDDTNLRYRGLTRDVMIARALADGLDATAIQQVADLLALDFHLLNLHAVSIETTKSERAYNNLLVTLPSGPSRDAALSTMQTADTAAVAAKAGALPISA